MNWFFETLILIFYFTCLIRKSIWVKIKIILEIEINFKLHNRSQKESIQAVHNQFLVTEKSLNFVFLQNFWIYQCTKNYENYYGCSSVIKISKQKFVNSYIEDVVHLLKFSFDL